MLCRAAANLGEAKECKARAKQNKAAGFIVLCRAAACLGKAKVEKAIERTKSRPAIALSARSPVGVFSPNSW